VTEDAAGKDGKDGRRGGDGAGGRDLRPGDMAGAPGSEPAESWRERRFRVRRERAHAFDAKFESAARWMLRRGIHPNHFTFLQVPVFVVSIIAAVEGWAWTFVLLIAFVIILDGGDGILARVGRMETRAGAVLDSTFDTMGIAIVLWGASRFAPAAETWLLFLFVGNTMLFVQNALVGNKVVSYVRGPILVGVVFPEVLLSGLVLASFIVAWLLLSRMRGTVRALFQPIPA
jgi:phosphatidylglycerophosphate synthase